MMSLNFEGISINVELLILELCLYLINSPFCLYFVPFKVGRKLNLMFNNLFCLKRKLQICFVDGVNVESVRD